MMNIARNNPLTIDEEGFFGAFGRMREEAPRARCFLSLENGEILRFYEESDAPIEYGRLDPIENELERANVGSGVLKLLELPEFPLEHHNEFVERFLDSDFIGEDDCLKHGEDMRKCPIPHLMVDYEISESTITEYQLYLREEILKPMAETRLALHGIDPQWT